MIKLPQKIHEKILCINSIVNEVNFRNNQLLGNNSYNKQLVIAIKFKTFQQKLQHHHHQPVEEVHYRNATKNGLEPPSSTNFHLVKTTFRIHCFDNSNIH